MAPLDPDAPPAWRNVSSRRSRQLLRNVDHTGAVHWFVAALARQSRTLGWEIAQIDPPHRASRYFRHRDGLRSIHPDAFGLLRRQGKTWALFLDWEWPVLIVFDDELAATHFLRVAGEEMHQARAAVPIRVSHGSLLEHVGPLGPAWRSADDLGDHPEPPSI